MKQSKTKRWSPHLWWSYAVFLASETDDSLSIIYQVILPEKRRFLQKGVGKEATSKAKAECLANCKLQLISLLVG